MDDDGGAAAARQELFIRACRSGALIRADELMHEGVDVNGAALDLLPLEAALIGTSRALQVHLVLAGADPSPRPVWNAAHPIVTVADVQFVLDAGGDINTADGWIPVVLLDFMVGAIEFTQHDALDRLALVLAQPDLALANIITCAQYARTAPWHHLADILEAEVLRSWCTLASLPTGFHNAELAVAVNVCLQASRRRELVGCALPLCTD